MLCFIIDTKIATVETRLASVRVMYLPLHPSYPTTHSQTQGVEHNICGDGEWLPVIPEINFSSRGHFYCTTNYQLES